MSRIYHTEKCPRCHRTDPRLMPCTCGWPCPLPADPRGQQLTLEEANLAVIGMAANHVRQGRSWRA